MKRLFLFVLLTCLLVLPVSALELELPPAPRDVLMPEDTQNFGNGLLELFEKSLQRIRPDLAEAASVSISVVASAMLLSMIRLFGSPVKSITELLGAAAIVGLLLSSSNSLVQLAMETIQQLSDYGKLLLPVMTAAMASQGGVTSSAALYTGTAAFDMVLGSLMSKFLAPAVYLYLALSTACSVSGEEYLSKGKEMVKSFAAWSLKTILVVFTTYMSITGVVSGTTDAVALKATKLTIATAVPIVGSVLSDASEAVLLSAGLLKNAAGIYGILALLSVFLAPFLKIGIHYLVWKATAALCGIFAGKTLTALVDDFSSAMGLLLAMTGSECLLLLISSVCFMKGVGS